jgi:hypothetical protein
MTPGEPQLMRFLLGEVSEQEQSDIETRMLGDDDLFLALEQSEDELVDRYVGGGLSSSERAAFERRLLAVPRIRQRVANASALQEVSRGEAAEALSKDASLDSAIRTAPSISANSSTPEKRTSWRRGLAALAQLGNPHLRSVAVAASLVIVLGGGALLLRSIERDRSMPPAMPSLSYDLFPGRLRSSIETPVLLIPASHEWVLLRLDLGNLAPRGPLEGTLESAEEGTLSRRGDLRGATEDPVGVVRWVVPASLLKPGSYTLTVREPTAGEPLDMVAHYEFIVR